MEKGERERTRKKLWIPERLPRWEKTSRKKWWIIYFLPSRESRRVKLLDKFLLPFSVVYDRNQPSLELSAEEFLCCPRSISVLDHRSTRLSRTWPFCVWCSQHFYEIFVSCFMSVWNPPSQGNKPILWKLKLKASLFAAINFSPAFTSRDNIHNNPPAKLQLSTHKYMKFLILNYVMKRIQLGKGDREREEFLYFSESLSSSFWVKYANEACDARCDDSSSAHL